MRKIIALFLVLGLAACATVKNPVTNARLYQAELAYDGGLKTFNKYKDLCAQRVIPSSCRTYVNRGQVAIAKVRKARREVEIFVDTNPNLDASSVVLAFEVAVRNFVSVSNP